MPVLASLPRAGFGATVLGVTEPLSRPFQGLRPVGGSYTFGGRQGRMSPTRRRAFNEIVPRYVAEPPYPNRRIVVEVGCGKGHATAAMALDESDSLVVACEPNGAIIANLALLIEEQGISNVKLWVGDAFDLLGLLGTASVAEIRVWFPDPWPKARQAGKRLITPARLVVMTDALVAGGRIRLATDDANYAAEALAAIDAEPRLVGRVVPRPDERPLTVFEERGLREGRATTDIEAARS